MGVSGGHRAAGQVEPARRPGVTTPDGGRSQEAAILLSIDANIVISEHQVNILFAAIYCICDAALATGGSAQRRHGSPPRRERPGNNQLDRPLPDPVVLRHAKHRASRRAGPGPQPGDNLTKR